MKSGDEVPVTVGELVAFLQTLPPERQVLYQAYSDYQPLTLDEIQTAEAVRKTSYYMREHPTMSDENKAAKQVFVVFPGN